MGSGSTIVAAESLGVRSIGLERSGTFFRMAQKSITDRVAMNTRVFPPKSDGRNGNRKK